MLDLAILGLLDEQELHGYEIRRRLRDELGLFANVSFGSLYPALSRLEAASAVAVTESTAGAPPGAPFPRPAPSAASGPSCGPGGPAPHGAPSGRARSTGSPTAAAQLFDELLDADEPAGTDDARSFGLRLAFARHLAPQARLALLERRRAQLVRRLARPGARGRRRTASTSTPARWWSTPPKRPSTTSPGSTVSSSPSDRSSQHPIRRAASPAAGAP